MESRFLPIAIPFLKSAKLELSEPLGVEEIARAIHTSPRTLWRRFDQELGRPIASEIRRLRISLAKRLLRDMEKTIKEMAPQTGFGNTQGLLQAFKREVGMSPRAYRKQLESEKHPEPH